ncbi:MAG: metallopeptidase family protein [Planctomycetota bacterium]
MVTRQQRRLFDELLDDLIARLPEHVVALFDETPLIVEDEPSEHIRRDTLGPDDDGDLLGVFSGTSIVEDSVMDSGHAPDDIHLFRGPIIRLANDFAAEQGVRFDEALAEQVRITLLHEVGHHFGLDEDDLDRLGYA